MNDAAISAAIALATMLIGWGMTRSKVQDLERRIERMETLNDRIHEVYVSRDHFNETLEAIKETQRDLKADIKQILDLLRHAPDRGAG